jgi:hypothetical protein
VGGLATAIGLQYSAVDVDTDALAARGLLTTRLLLALSGLAAGWVAGRAARYDGARNGLLAGLLLALLLALLGAAGAYTAADGRACRSRWTATCSPPQPSSLPPSAWPSPRSPACSAASSGRSGTATSDDVLVGTRPGGVAGSDTEVSHDPRPPSRDRLDVYRHGRRPVGRRPHRRDRLAPDETAPLTAAPAGERASPCPRSGCGVGNGDRADRRPPGPSSAVDTETVEARVRGGTEHADTERVDVADADLDSG